jgi:hypothetical protein
MFILIPSNAIFILFDDYMAIAALSHFLLLLHYAYNMFRILTVDFNQQPQTPQWKQICLKYLQHQQQIKPHTCRNT